MSTIQPLRAIRYAPPEPRRDISTRLAPPYDILDDRDKQVLLAKDPLNFVRIDLPHTPPKSAGPPKAYGAAQAQLAAWLADGTMVRDERPMLYVYHQRFRHAGTDFTRKMFFARLRLEPFGTGSVFPHEHTFGGPKEDRLALTKATQANLSPIFGLYEDARNEISQWLERVLAHEPLAVGAIEDVENRLWGIDDANTITRVGELMQPKPIYIADGHHRYGTGLLYRDWLVGQRGALPIDHPANFVLCVLCAMEDPGLLILPTHRVLPGLNIAGQMFGADPNVTIAPLDAAGPDQAVGALARLGPQAVALHNPRTHEYLGIQPRSASLLDAYEPDHSPAWRRLALSLLHAYLLQRVVMPKLCGGKEPAIQYIKSGPQAVQAAQETGGVAFLLQPTTMNELRAVCGAGDLMPHKSTYFYPKLASGLVINPLSE